MHGPSQFRTATVSGTMAKARGDGGPVPATTELNEGLQDGLEADGRAWPRSRGIGR